MNARSTLAIAVGALLLLGLGAAVGAATPAEYGNDAEAELDANASVPDDPGEDIPVNDTVTDGADANTTQPSDAGTPDRLGPADGLPEQAPDRVSEIHATILQYLGDSPWQIGDALSDLLSDDAAAEQPTDDQVDEPEDEQSDDQAADGQANVPADVSPDERSPVA